MNTRSRECLKSSLQIADNISGVKYWPKQNIKTQLSNFFRRFSYLCNGTNIEKYTNVNVHQL